MELYNNNICKKFVVSGHKGEALSIRGMMMDHGITKEAIQVELLASNTLENVVNSVSYLNEYFDQAKSRSLILLCKNYAARRCVLTTEKHICVDKLFVETVDLLNVDSKSNEFPQTFLEKILDEIDKIRTYSLNSDICCYEDQEGSDLNLIEKQLRSELDKVVNLLK